MRFHDPWVLFLIPLVIPFIIFSMRRSTGRLRFSSLSQIKTVKGSSPLNPRQILLFFRLGIAVFFIIALARPQSGKKMSEVSSEGIDIMMAMDTSGSMAALDLKIEDKPAMRIDVVKKVAAEFVTKSPNDRIGLVVFGETAFVQCPLTLDHRILANLIEGVQLGVAGDSTSLGDAIGVAVTHMKDLKAKSRVLILLTDGKSTSGIIPPLKAAELAHTYKVKIYTIGVGVEGEAPYLVDTPMGKRVVYQHADLDEETLKQIAQMTGGIFYRAKDSDTLEKVYGEIAQLETTKALVKEYTEYNELYAGFTLLGLTLLLMEVILGNTWLRKVP